MGVGAGVAVLGIVLVILLSSDDSQNYVVLQPLPGDTVGTMGTLVPTGETMPPQTIPVAPTATTVDTTTLATTTTTQRSTTTAVSTTVPVGKFCVTDIAWDDTLNVRTGPGVAFSIIDTLPFYAFEITNTGIAGRDENGTWYEIRQPRGAGWVASWDLEPAPCGPFVDHDLVLDLAAMTIDADPGEWDPPNQAQACGEGGFCFFNGSIADRITLPLDPAAEVHLLSLDGAGGLGAGIQVTLADLVAYLAGSGYDPAVHFQEASYPCPACAKPTIGLPYRLVVENGAVVEIGQWYVP